TIRPPRTTSGDLVVFPRNPPQPPPCGGFLFAFRLYRLYCSTRHSTGAAALANPDPYNRTFSFNDFQASNPSSPLPGNSLDNELENVEAAINGTQTALEYIRRSDGALKNGIVTLDTLDPTVLAGVGAGAL